jgi:adhesin transport system membrane fusion protein
MQLSFTPAPPPPKGLKKLWHKLSRGVLSFTHFVVEKTDPVDRFMADISPEHTERVRSYAHIVLWGMALFFLIAFVWSYFAMLDETTHAVGKVIPASQVQIIQNLEGGIVKQIFVREGQLVQAGQPLLQLDTAIYESNYYQQQNKALALAASIVRLSALAENRPFSPSPELQKQAADLVEHERQLYVSQQIEMAEAQENYAAIVKEYDLTKPLVKEGAASEVEVLRLERQINELQERVANYKSKILQDLNEAKGNLLVTNAAIEQYQDRIIRATVRAPVKGIVEQIKIRTIGGVAQPGAELMEVVPLEDSLLVEGKVSPRDIGFLRIGQPAMVKITAFDYSIYGGLPGKVEEISADAITETTPGSKGESYYLIRVRTHKNYLISKQGKPLYIIPGMVATIDITTGQKSVLTYLLKPILKAKDEALTER